MQLGICSYTYTWAIGVPGSTPEKPMNATGLLDKAAELEVQVVQFCDNLPLHLLSEQQINDLDNRAKRLGLQVEVGTRKLEPNRLRTYLGLAHRLDSLIVRIVIDEGDYKPSEDEIIRSIQEVIADYERLRVTLAIENHDRFAARTLARIVERAGSPNVGVCLDTVNSFGALEGPEAVVETLAPYTVNLHVKDFIIERANHQMGFVIEGAPAGQGRLDIPWLLGKLRAAGRDPNAIVELWTPPEESLEATIAKEDRWARESVEYLGEWLVAGG